MKILLIYAALLAASAALVGPVSRLATDADAPFLTIAAAQAQGRALTPSQVQALAWQYNATIAADQSAVARAERNDPWSTP